MEVSTFYFNFSALVHKSKIITTHRPNTSGILLYFKLSTGILTVLMVGFLLSKKNEVKEILFWDFLPSL